MSIFLSYQRASLIKGFQFVRGSAVMGQMNPEQLHIRSSTSNVTLPCFAHHVCVCMCVKESFRESYFMISC